MAALTADRDTRERVPQLRTPVAAAKIHAGALVALNSDGKAVPAADTAGLIVIGVAANASTSSGDVLRSARPGSQTRISARRFTSPTIRPSPKPPPTKSQRAKCSRSTMRAYGLSPATHMQRRITIMTAFMSPSQDKIRKGFNKWN